MKEILLCGEKIIKEIPLPGVVKMEWNSVDNKIEVSQLVEVHYDHPQAPGPVFEWRSCRRT